MSRDVTVTIRVPREMKQEIENVAKRLGVSQSAVWKILLYRNLGALNAEPDRGIAGLVSELTGAAARGKDAVP